MVKGLFVSEEFICIGATESELKEYIVSRGLPVPQCKIENLSEEFILENIDLDYLDWDSEEICKAVHALRCGVSEDSSMDYMNLLEDLENEVEEEEYSLFVGEDF